MIKRFHVFVEGRVQGVGFRGFCMMQAQQRGLTGSVTNLPNGLVEIFIQGEQDRIDSFLEAVQAGNQFIRVDDMSIKEVPAVPGEKRFGYGMGQYF
ncbi:MAG: acylphosphatase [Lactimicrobium massiliense]|nr:acylphosphatase [Lactimicrobium massiliense]MDD6229779.1 acylphosphatase [Lactimicrobium massiliense]MDD6727078.1 acylphosphatase [Lactimicrobium massiliense]